MKEFVLVDSNCELKGYTDKFKNSFVVSIEPSEDEKISRLESLFFSYSLLDDPVIFLKWIEHWRKEEISWLKESLEKCERDVIVFSAKEELLRTLGKPLDLLQPKAWEDEKWKEKVNELFRLRGTTIEKEAMMKLLERTGPHLDLICSEVEKLSVISKHISSEIVEKNVPKYASSAIFNFIHRLFERDEDTVILLKEALKDWHLLSIVKNIENYSLLLMQLISLGKTEYTWKDIQNVSRILEVKTPVIAEITGFPLGKKRGKNLLKALTFKEVSCFLEEIQKIEFKAKEGTREDFSLLRLTSEWVKKRGEIL